MENEKPDFGSPANPEAVGAALYRIKPGYVLREISGEFLAIPVSLQDELDSRVAVMNPVGKFLWEQLQQERTVAELIRAVTDSYEVSADEAGRDIVEFMDQLRINQLLLTNLEGKR